MYKRAFNPLVASSNLAPPTSKIKGLRESVALFSFPWHTHGTLGQRKSNKKVFYFCGAPSIYPRNLTPI